MRSPSRAAPDAARRASGVATTPRWRRVIARCLAACCWPLLAGAAGCASETVVVGPEVSSARGLVVSEAPLASRIGADVLARGGNAVDAAVATAFALAVVYPTAGNLGGGGFLVVHMQGREWALDFRETAPAAATRDMYVVATAAADAHDPGTQAVTADASLTGQLASGVPGSVAGLFAAHAQLGALPWASLLAPSIALAEDGFVVDTAFVEDLDTEAARLRRFPASASLYLTGGDGPDAAPLRPGDVWRNPDLAAVLRRIAASGPDGFYRGATADAIVAEMARGGGLITHADLAGYRAVWRQPLEFDYRGARICSMPPPSSGGVALQLLCALLAPYDLPALGWHSPAALHLQAEASRRAFAARNACLGDPDFVENPLAQLFDPAWADAQRAGISPDHATPSRDVDPGLPPGVRRGSDLSEAQHTTHLSVIDARGDAVALTTTLNGSYGSAVVVTGAGFLLNNEMDDFATRPGTPNTYGLVQGESNAIEPGKRMLSSMTPTIVLDADGRVLLVTGAAGGPRIISATFGIVSAVLDFGADVRAAVFAPRIHHQHLPDELMVETQDLSGAGTSAGPEATLDALRALGHALHRVKALAAAPSIGRDPADAARWLGVAEPRSHGAAAGVR